MKKGIFVSIFVLCTFLIGSCNSSPTGFKDDENTQLLAYYPLDDGTYTVGVGNATQLSNIRIPDTYLGKAVSSITENGFTACTKLTNITLPNNLVRIGSSAFKGCSSLASIKIPDKTSEISDSAFENCTSVVSVEFGKSLSRIGSSAFSGCKNDVYFSYPNTITNWKKISLDDKWLDINSFSVIHCSDGDYSLWEQETMNFSFRISFSNGESSINVGETTDILIDENDGSQIINRQYVFTTSNSSIASCDDGTIVGKAPGNVTITAKEVNSNQEQSINLEVTNCSTANGTFDFSSENSQKRTEIIGALEKYAMNHNLAGLALAEGDTYFKISNRVKLTANQYIPEYGLGLIETGEIIGDMENEQNSEHKKYLHLPRSFFDSLDFDRWGYEADSRTFTDYLTSAFWEKRMNNSKNDFEYYPVLAKDKVVFDGQEIDFNRPIPVVNGYEIKPTVGNINSVKSNTWRVYVKTDSIKYRYSGQQWDGAPNFDGMQVKIEDYVFTLFLMTCRYSHFLDTSTYQDIAGIDDFYESLGAASIKKDESRILNVWNAMIENGSLGIKTGIDQNNGDYLQFTFADQVNIFYAMNYFTKKTLSPMPKAFITAIGNGTIYEGTNNYGETRSSQLIPLIHQGKITDFILSVGPYYLESQSILKKNEMWNETNRYKIQGIKIVDTKRFLTNENELYDMFNEGIIDACYFPAGMLKDEANIGQVFKLNNFCFNLRLNTCTQERWDRLYSKRQGDFEVSSRRWYAKECMSNENFLKGIYYSINRKELASNINAQPTNNYLPNIALIDSNNRISYNSTQAHANAVSAYQTYDDGGVNTYGYSREKAVLYFKNSVSEMIKKGIIRYNTSGRPYEISLAVRLAYEGDLNNYGNMIKKYIEEAFNDATVSDGKIKLNIQLVYGWGGYLDVYESLYYGAFDLVVSPDKGRPNSNSISKNAIDYFRSLESEYESSYGFINWGDDTAKISEKQPLIFDGMVWSYDALCEAMYDEVKVNNGVLSN